MSIEAVVIVPPPRNIMASTDRRAGTFSDSGTRSLRRRWWKIDVFSSVPIFFSSATSL